MAADIMNLPEVGQYTHLALDNFKKSLATAENEPAPQ
jgi:hypothetical protein